MLELYQMQQHNNNTPVSSKSAVVLQPCSASHSNTVHGLLAKSAPAG